MVHPGFKDETGNRYARLLVVARSPNVRSRAQWLCKCDCGGWSVVDGCNLRSGNTTSCGCKKIEEARKAYRSSDPMELRVWLASATRMGWCADCERWPVHACQMDFDHLWDKKFHISQSAEKHKMPKMVAEINKCDLVCASCHRLRTHERTQLRKVA